MLKCLFAKIGLDEMGATIEYVRHSKVFFNPNPNPYPNLIINDKYDFNDPLRASYVPRLLKNQYRGISVC